MTKKKDKNSFNERRSPAGFRLQLRAQILKFINNKTRQRLGLKIIFLYCINNFEIFDSLIIIICKKNVAPLATFLRAAENRTKRGYKKRLCTSIITRFSSPLSTNSLNAVLKTELSEICIHARYRAVEGWVCRRKFFRRATSPAGSMLRAPTR